MADNNPEVTAYVREIATALGVPWQATSARISGTVATLVGPEGVWASVSSERANGSERIVFEGWLPDKLTAHQPHGSSRPITRASLTRKPASVAKSLHSRFLPALIDLARRAREHSDHREQRAAQLTALVDALSTTAGPDARPGQDSVSLGQFGAPVCMTARVIEPLWRQESVVRFSIDAIGEHAMSIADLLGKLHRSSAHTDHPTAQTP